MLSLEHVRKDFGSVHAVRDVSFEIPRGSTLGLLGPNGAGKTTTMRMILGIYAPDGGSIAWDGVRISGSMRHRFGYLPEERGLYGKMRVRDQIAYFGRLHGLREPEITKRTNRWIEQLGLNEYAARACGELSKGNQQKVQVACAALHEPELLVLDEPFSGLDPVNAQILLATVRDLRARGTTLVLSSHQMWHLQTLCDAYCIVTGGESRSSGTLEQLRATWPVRVIRIAPPSPAARAVLDRLSGARAITSANGSIEYAVPTHTHLPDLLRDLMQVEAIARFDVLDPSLYDIYIRTIEEHA